MQFINKNNNKEILHINSFEKSILHDKATLSSAEKDSFLQKLISFKEKYWITCDCNNDALLIICLLNSNIYIRCKTLETHDKYCFFRQNKVYLNKQNQTIFKRIKQYNIYKNASNLSNNSEKDTEQSQRFRSLSRLGQVLYTIIEDARLNFISNKNSVYLIDQLTAVDQAFNDPEKLITKKIALGKYHRYFLRHSSLNKSQQYLVKAQSWFPKSVKPFILFSSVSSSINNNSFIIEKEPDNPFYVNNTISLPSNWINKEKSSPYFILTSALLDEQGEIFLKDAFAMPIFNKKSLMPVESNYERTVLKIILSTCKSLKDIKIEKPLFDIIEKEFRFRPDFIIYYKDEKKIFIEVLGSQNNEYLNHKNAIALKARQYCHEYISIRAFNLNQEYEPFVHKLKKAMTIHFTSDNYVL